MYSTKVTNLLYNIHATYMPYPQPIHPGKKTHFFVIHGKYLPAYIFQHTCPFFDTGGHVKGNYNYTCPLYALYMHM